MKNKYINIEYKNKEYIVGFTNDCIPFIIDKVFFQNTIDKQFYRLEIGYISYNKKYLHHLIKPLNNNNLSIDHINQIKTDNREENLRYATQTEQNKNQSKRKRTVKLPDNCNIKPNEIPTFVWYSKAGSNRGDRWVIEIKGKYTWKTTCSKLFSTNYKFELVKKHLRELIKNKPDLLEDHCINGRLLEKGRILRQEYIDILNLVKQKNLGENYIKQLNLHIEHQLNLIEIEKNIDYLKENLTFLTEEEKKLFENNKIEGKIKVEGNNKIEGKIKQEYKNGTNLPKNVSFDIPKFCYYIPISPKKSDGFCCSKFHPRNKSTNKDWYSTKRKDIPISEKFNQLMCYINDKPWEYKESKSKQLFSDSQINHILKYKTANKTNKDLIEIFNKRFPQVQITEQNIKDIITNKIKPINTKPLSDTKEKLKSKINSYSKEEMIEIFKLKTNSTTSLIAQNEMRKKFPKIIINKNIISQIWKGRLNEFITF